MNYSHLDFFYDNKTHSLFFDPYNKKIIFSIDEKLIYETTIKKLRGKETFIFNDNNDTYKLIIDTRYYFFKKCKFLVYRNNNLISLNNKLISRHWLIKTKNRNYYVDTLYNHFTSSLRVIINNEVVFDTLNKLKTFEPKKREIKYDSQTFAFIKDNVENEYQTLTLKFNVRSNIFCLEDQSFMNHLTKFKKNQQHLSLKKYLKTKLLEIFTLPIFIDLLLALQIYVINSTKIESITNVIILFIVFYLSFCLIIIGFYLVGFKMFKKRFSF